MAKTRKNNLTTSSLNEEYSKKTKKNIAEDQLNHIEYKKPNVIRSRIRKCSVKLKRLKSTSSGEKSGILYNLLPNNNLVGDNLIENIINSVARKEGNNSSHDNGITTKNLIEHRTIKNISKNNLADIPITKTNHIIKELQISLVKATKQNDNPKIIKMDIDSTKTENINDKIIPFIVETDEIQGNIKNRTRSNKKLSLIENPRLIDKDINSIKPTNIINDKINPFIEVNDENQNNIKKRTRSNKKLPLIENPTITEKDINLRKSRNIINDKINPFINVIDENQHNIMKRTRSNQKLALTGKKKDSQSINQNFSDLPTSQNDNVHSSGKRILKNVKENQVEQTYTDSNIITRRKKQILAKVELEEDSKQNNSIRKNKMNSQKYNKKQEKILEETVPAEPITAESNSQNTAEAVNLNNDSSNITEPELEKFFRASRRNKMSNIDESEFRLEKNIHKKEDLQANKKKQDKIVSEKTKESSSSMENQTTTKKEKNKNFDKIIEDIENLNPNIKMSKTKDVGKFFRMSLTLNNRKRKFEVEADNLNITDEINKTNNNKMIEKVSKQKSNLSNSEISVILDEIDENESVVDNMINKDAKQNITKNIFKTTPKDRKIFVENKNNSDIFEFPSSQSSSEFSENKNIDDNDIIKKLIKEKKVQVAKYKKGTGRLNLKRERKRKLTERTQKHSANTDKFEHENIDGVTDVNRIDGKYGNISLERKSLFSPQKHGFSPLARAAMKMRAHFNNTTSESLFIRKGKEIGFSPLVKSGMKRRVPIVDKGQLLDAAKAFLAKTSHITKKNYNVPIKTQDFTKPLPFIASTPWRSSNLVRNLSDPLPPSNLNYKRSSLQFSDISIRKKDSLVNEYSDFSNLSNIENLQPENKNLTMETNPRKGLSNRTPLKNINIIEVVNLPPLALKNFNSLENSLESEVNSSNDGKLVDTFDFEEIITDTKNNNHSKFVIPKKRNLKDKLKKLKRLLPNKNLISKPTRFSYNTTKEIYKPNSPVKQKNIKEMFSSTMIDENVQKVFNATTEKNIEGNLDNPDYSSDLHIFDDFSEESTFANNSSIKTYSRIRKRKKMRHEFITCLTSESEEEEDSHERKGTKRIHEKKKKEEELTKFYDDFNSIIEDVDNYELMVVPESTK